MRFLIPLVLILLSTMPRQAVAGDEAVAGASITFDRSVPLEILPRRSHQTLQVTSYNIRTLDATILHAPEADTLAALTATSPVVAPPPEAIEVWHGPIKATAPDGSPAQAGQKAVTAIDALKLVPSLQPGVYYLVVKSEDQAMAVQPFLISNLGLQAFAGTDGIAVVVRLLSEAKPAQNVEVALVSGNNRELARVRTGVDGVARFGRDTAATGRDEPAALYAYGADGEFSAIGLGGKSLLDVPNTARSDVSAWIAVDGNHPRPGQSVRGLAILRQANGKGYTGQADASLVAPDGRILEQQPLASDRGGISGFTLHAPPGLARWTIRVDAADGARLATLDPFKAKPQEAETQPPDTSTDMIQLGAGRRTFQPGETANISVQPPETAEVTLAVIDRSVHAVMTQHIDKAGGVVQIPLPGDATGGVFVFASGMTPPDEASGTPSHRSYGLEWLDIDQGAQRTGVRLDLPESADAGSSIPVHVTLSDNQTARTDFAVIGTAAGKPSGIDPFAQLYARHAPRVGIYDDYAMLRQDGQAAQPLSGLSALAAPQDAGPAPVLLWTGIEDAPGGSANPLIALPDSVTPGRLRLSVIAANADAVGFAESGIDIKAASAHKATATPHEAPGSATARNLAPGAALTIGDGDTAVIAAIPIVAAPLFVSRDSQPHYLSSSDPDALDLARRFADLVTPEEIPYDLLLAEAAGMPTFARDNLRRQLMAALHRGDFPKDRVPIALFALYHDGGVPLWAEPALAGKLPTAAGWLAHTCRYGLTRGDADLKALPASESSDDLEAQVLAVLVTRVIDTQQRSVALPEGLLEDIADQAFRHDLSPRLRLGLRALQASLANGPALRPEWDAPPALADENDRARVFVLKAAGTGDAIKSADKRTLYTLTLSHWPDAAPE